MGEEAMEGPDCRAKILSQDYRDFLIPGYREDIEVRFPKEKTCVQEGDFGLRVISAAQEIVGELSLKLMVTLRSPSATPFLIWTP